MLTSLFSLFVLHVAATIGLKSSDHTGSVYCEGRSCKFVEDVLDFDKASAVGTFNDSLLVSGWGILDVVAGHAGSEAQLTNEDIMYAAGFVEGALTAKHIESNYFNLVGGEIDSDVKEELNKWFVTQRKWAESMIEMHNDDPLWRHTSYIFAQLDGLFAGYHSVRGEKKDSLDMFALNFLNAIGDSFDLTSIVSPDPTDWRNMTAEEAEKYFYSLGHCSVLIKLLPGYENLLMSHNSWFLYSATDRIYKHYNFKVHDAATASRKMSFSSYPGLLISLDDFYQLESGLVILQTTNSIFNESLYDLIVPQSLFSWQRVHIANMMARNGREWTDILARYNSGTYNTQYMVLDLKLVTLNEPLRNNTLWVAEQIPGLVVAQDLTHELQYGYFASYNIPYFEEIFNKSGHQAFVEKHGNHYTHQLAPRAKIFRRDHSKVNDLESLKAVIRSNDFINDPYSDGNPMAALCSRGDLFESDSYLVGCTDGKVADIAMARRFEASIINGPTLGTHLPPFSWSSQRTDAFHKSLPETYNFSFILTKPRFNV